MKQHKFFIQAFFAALLFGLSTPLSKILLNSNNSPILLASIYYLGAAILLIPFVGKKLIYEIQILLNNKKDLVRMLGAIIFGGILGPVLLLYGISLTTATTSSLLLNLETVGTAIISYLLFKEHIGKKVLISSILTVIAGCLLIFDYKFNINLGGLLIILACFSWGLDNNFTATVESISPITNTIVKGFFAGSFNLILAFCITDINIEMSDFSYALIIGFLSYGLSIVFYISSARNIGATRSQIIFSSNPFLGSLISFIIFSNMPTIQFFIAMTIMVVATVILFNESHNHIHYHPTLNHDHEHDHADKHHSHTHSDNNAKKIHSHSHSHEEMKHKHTHYPDIHHRHKH